MKVKKQGGQDFPEIKKSPSLHHDKKQNVFLDFWLPAS